jgi:hypothetical protein
MFASSSQTLVLQCTLKRVEFPGNSGQIVDVTMPQADRNFRGTPGIATPISRAEGQGHTVAYAIVHLHWQERSVKVVGDLPRIFY